MAGTEELVSDEIYKEDGYVYSLEDDGFVWKTPTTENPRGRRVKITTERIKNEEDFQYYINKEGYLVKRKIVKSESHSHKTKRTERRGRVGSSVKELVSENKILFSSIGIVILLLMLGVITLAGQLGSKNYQYSSLQQGVKNINDSNYLLRENLSGLRNNYYGVEANFTNISDYYKALLYNVSNPYVETLAAGKSVYLAGYVYNSSYSYEPNWAYYKEGNFWYVYNYSTFNTSFNLPYSGYLVVNLTSTLQNSADGGPIDMYFTQERPYFNISNGTAVLQVNRYNASYATIAPAQNKNYVIPVLNGTTYMVIYNWNSSGASITYNMKYVGFYHKMKLT
jgi:hypothetical protein